MHLLSGDFGEGGWKWHGGIVYKDYIYGMVIWFVAVGMKVKNATIHIGVPNNADHVLKIDPSSDTISLLDKNEPLVSGMCNPIHTCKADDAFQGGIEFHKMDVINTLEEVWERTEKCKLFKRARP